jgi:multidrug efflux pump subunit AcrA (membrane-fusion protein)
MRRRIWIFFAGALAIAALAAFVTRSSWTGGGASAQGPQRARMVSVEVAKAERKPVPVDVDAIGTVTPISSVALKSRVETTIVSVHFEDGAKVNEGDLLFTLDARQIDAQIERPRAAARDQRSSGAARCPTLQRPDRRAPPPRLTDNAKTQA